MGGSAFSSGPNPLSTPRMPRAVYTTVKERCHAILRELYLVVASPIDGPGKSDFGDIDFVVAWPKNSSESLASAFRAIQEAFGAVRVIYEKGNSTSANFALPWPLDIPALETSSDNLQRACKTDQTNKNLFIQVDVKICSSLEQLQWILFKHGHGDIWNLIGTTIRPYGLTVDDDAMWVRIPEMEHKDKKRSKVFLSSEPETILHFLGLPTKSFWEQPFDNVQDMYEYVAQCRMFHVKEQKDAEPDESRRSLKSNDRKRMKYRPGFRRWVDEFVPKCRSEGRYLNERTTRDKVTSEAIEWFHVEEEYRTRRQQCLLEQQKDFIVTNVIKPAIPLHDSSDLSGLQQRSLLVRAFKQIILEGDESFGVLPKHNLKDEQGFYIVENVEAFINTQRNNIGKIVHVRDDEAS